MTDAVRILVVDDSPAIRQVLGGILRAAGCEVVTAEGVRPALRRLRAFEPDVILTDFNMPRLNGEAFVRLVRRDPRLVNLPVFVVSSEDDPGIQKRMEEAGADAWFDKPVDVQGLVRSIRAAVSTPSQQAAPRPRRRASEAFGAAA
ncbi:response regulator [Brevundimonas goettingensis]|uniref:Response regulator n=1 Tax=Brevundimonas goettingensis TaxID=2774190 RepID=A0A975C1A8_9CAUL|nr:response regulator [Brevundimonas goettingensis]QTC89955.1 response regulator [Brevundimonas goettingensis]